ncbi:hypothetical protein KB206_06360 [Microvirga sp. STS02]|uniref:DUF5694 domain-containing protein n=1 Tax=Hymenobacter negativus TaxID=2795026 RepID=UPI0018DBB198|nr:MULTISPECIES: DUF5694 domain-containing protein [Bacteria]MBH8568495.1 hypothetical protein [Hymenobacter negativus]MBR7208229.1 hypothetical protein [Microvirga sp. STS02]
MKHTFFFLFACLIAANCGAQTRPSDILLLGTFHFHNPGADVAKTKTFDVMAPKAQAELETITQKISAFHPDKIFVEWPWDEQLELDKLYNAYLGSQFEQFVNTTYPAKRQNFFLKNEIVQLAFRAGKKAHLTRIYALDYTKTSFPFDSVLKAMQAAKQVALLQKSQDAIKHYETSQNQKLETYTLTQLLLDANSPGELTLNKGLYLDILNRAGTTDNFAGAFLVSEWYRRNLYMYSLVQKTMTPQDGKALVLVGSGHAAMMREFIASDQQFRLKELKDVLK